MELILTLPVLLLLLVAAIQFASVLVVNSTLAAATTEAARLAAAHFEAEDIETKVNEFLAVHRLSLGPGARLVIEDDQGGIQTFGDATLSGESIGGPVSINSVRATLLVTTEAAPIPNALASYCVDYTGRQYELCAVTTVLPCDCP